MLFRSEVEVRPDEEAEQKPLRKAIDAAKNVGGAVAGGTMTAVNALKGFDTAAPLNKLP